MACLFCQIIKKEIPAEIVFEDDLVIAFRDIKPIVPVHILIVPKVHISSVNDLELKNIELIGKLILVGQKIAREEKIEQSGYRLIINTGKEAGQTIEHLHLHLIGGQPLPWN